MTVELVDQLGNDLSIVNAARVSVGGHSTTFTDKDRGLLRRLASDRHGTPFEHLVFTFRVTTSIKVAREWFRHRIGSFSELSTRYTRMEPGFAMPTPRRQTGKAMAYTFEPLTGNDLAAARTLIERAYEQSYVAYEALLAQGVAREVASFVLPLGMLTAFVWTVNFRSLTNFLSLRTAPQALLEIREEASEVERLVAAAVPETYAAWLDAGKLPYPADKVPL